MWNESCPQNNHNRATPCLSSHKAGNAHFKTSFVVPGAAEGLHYLKYLIDFWVLLGLRAVVVPFAIKERKSSIWLSYFLFIFVPYTIIQCRRFARTQRTNWDKKNKRLTSNKMLISIVCFASVWPLLSSMAVCTTWITSCKDPVAVVVSFYIILISFFHRISRVLFTFGFDHQWRQLVN